MSGNTNFNIRFIVSIIIGEFFSCLNRNYLNLWKKSGGWQLPLSIALFMHLKPKLHQLKSMFIMEAVSIRRVNS